MNEKHHDSLRQYVNDMIAVERNITNSLKLQMEDEHVQSFHELRSILDRAFHASESRIQLLKKLSAEEDASFGAAVKESVTAVTGTLAGIYGKIREHPVSRMVRDDIIALDLASVGYGMLLTLGLAIGHEECAAIAERGIEETPPLIIALTDLLPLIVAEELAGDAPLANPAAVQLASIRIRDAWSHR